MEPSGKGLSGLTSADQHGSACDLPRALRAIGEMEYVDELGTKDLIQRPGLMWCVGELALAYAVGNRRDPALPRGQVRDTGLLAGRSIGAGGRLAGHCSNRCSRPSSRRRMFYDE